MSETPLYYGIEIQIKLVTPTYSANHNALYYTSHR